MRTSVNAKVASRTATAMSQAATRPTPPARAGPATRAMTGVSDVQSVLRIAGNSLTPWSSDPAPRDSRRSIPEQNTGPVWVRTITRTDSSRVAVSRWAESSRRTCAESALRLRGESSVIVAVPPVTSRCTSSSSMTVTVAADRSRSHGGGAGASAVRTVLFVTEAPTTVWHAWRRHVDLCRTSAAICRP